MSLENNYMLHRRFDRMGRLVGDKAMETLFKSHAIVIGLGGVGGWAAESLARSGIGQITLVDFDEICVTNANRQIQALQGLVGEKKALVLAERLKKINPQIIVNPIVDFYRLETSAQILSDPKARVLDCIDNITAKCHLLAQCRRLNMRVVTSGGAAGRMDILKMRSADLAETTEDPMLQQVRKVLRQKYDFPREGNFNIPAVYSEEKIIPPKELHYDKGEGFRCVCPHGENAFHTCEKRNIIFGSVSFVTGSFGFLMASKVVEEILQSVTNSDKIHQIV